MDRYRFILAEETVFSVVLMCVVLKVSRSGYYAWRRGRAHLDKPRTAEFDAHVAAAWKESSGRYGSRRIQAELNGKKVLCSRTRVAAAMRRQGLRARGRRRFKATTDSAHTHPVAPNLLERNFEASEPNQAWVGDITYVPTAEGWLYLAVLMDLFSRRIVGWASSSRIDRHLTLTALRMAIGTRRPTKGLVHHTDRGSQYASREYRDALQRAGISCSMSRKGDCWDNAPAESFFATLKVEELHHHRFATRDEARTTILRYLAWYNATRRHSTINHVSPAHFESLHQPLPLAA